MPGLLRGMARTAVISGTATAVSGRVARRQAERFTERDAHIAAERQQAYAQEMYGQQPPAPPAVAPTTAPAPTAPAVSPAAGAPDPDDLLDRLQRLGDLRAQGILTEDEFAAQKARLLAG